MKPLTFSLLLLTAASFSGGCMLLQTPGPNITNTYKHPTFKKDAIHDVGILPFKNETTLHRPISAQVMNQFTNEFNRRGWYVLHDVKPEDLAVPGRLKSVDAVIKGQILDYKDQEPFKVGVRIWMVDLDTQETLWSIQQVFDASRREVVEGVKEYYNYNIEKSHPLMGYKLYLISMNKFMEFTMKKIVDAIDERIMNEGVNTANEAGKVSGS